MKLTILTTQTLHHTYFVKEMSKKCKNINVIYETNNDLNIPYNTHHPYEEDREDFESSRWFNGNKPILEDFSEATNVKSINSSLALSLIKKNNPDLVIVFGTGLIREELLSFCGKRIFNLHGGNPEEYRGLDSHLWSIYNNNFSGLITTIHRVEKDFDTGDIVLQKEIPLWSGMKIHELRSSNTESCIEISNSMIETHLNKGKVTSRKQSRTGKYFSAMPTDLKSVVKRKFNSYINKRFL